MATEPTNTSNAYSSTVAYVAPVGRLPILGKARAQIDQLRVSIAATLNEMKNRDAAQALAVVKVTADNAAQASRVIYEQSKVTAENAAVTSRTAAEVSKMSAEGAAITSRTAAENAALATKTTAEKQLLDQKTATELANTSNIIPTTIGINSTSAARTTFLSTNASNVAPVGVVGAQQALYQAQRDGFARDAEQKLAKIMADVWSVQRSMSDPVTATNATLAEAQIKGVFNKARSGVGIPQEGL